MYVINADAENPEQRFEAFDDLYPVLKEMFPFAVERRLYQFNGPAAEWCKEHLGAPKWMQVRNDDPFFFDLYFDRSDLWVLISFEIRFVNLTDAIRFKLEIC
jgi:hypothetical protein